MLGNTLRQARESRELPLREVEWAIRIRAEYLAALEREDFAALPAPVYARGFLRAYAQYLDLDPEPLIADFNAAHPSAREILSTRAPVRGPRRILAVTPALLGGIVLAILALAFFGYVGRQIWLFARETRAAAQTSPSPAVNLAPAPTPSVRPSPVPSASARTYTGVEVVIHLDAMVWLRVDVDGKPTDTTTAAGKTFPAGSVLTFNGTQQVHVRTGKAGHTFVTFNGADQGAMSGDAGGVGDKTYTKP